MGHLPLFDCIRIFLSCSFLKILICVSCLREFWFIQNVNEYKAEVYYFELSLWKVVRNIFLEASTYFLKFQC